MLSPELTHQRRRKKGSACLQKDRTVDKGCFVSSQGLKKEGGGRVFVPEKLITY